MLGAFPAMWFKMREDIGAPITDPTSPWPPNITYPKPAGLIKVNTPEHCSGTKVPLSSIKVHMRPKEWLDVSPHPSLWAEAKFQEALKIMSSRTRPVKMITESGHDYA